MNHTDRKTILITGNGFDLAHQMRTSYADFLDFVDLQRDAAKLSEENHMISSGGLLSGAVKLMISRLPDPEKQYLGKLAAADQESICNKIYQGIKSNIWLTYFKMKREQDRERWSDLEELISMVVRKAREEILHGNLDWDNYYRYDGFEIEDLMDVHMKWYNPEELAEPHIRVEKVLVEDFRQFQELLKLYLRLVYQSEIPSASTHPNITCIHPDLVITYNYTDTYHAVYDPARKIPICFLHGRLSDPTNAVVVGTETDMTDVRNILSELNKHTQKIVNNADNNYRVFLSRQPADSINSVIYGHSLCDNDAESLKQFLPNTNAACPIHKTYISCYSPDDKSREDKEAKVKNLELLLGADVFREVYAQGRIAFLDTKTEWEREMKALAKSSSNHR